MSKQYTPKKLVRPAAMDPQNSVSLFDANRRNEFDELYCVAAAILPRQVDEYWTDYLASLKETPEATE